MVLNATPFYCYLSAMTQIKRIAQSVLGEGISLDHSVLNAVEPGSPTASHIEASIASGKLIAYVGDDGAVHLGEHNDAPLHWRMLSFQDFVSALSLPLSFERRPKSTREGVRWSALKDHLLSCGKEHDIYSLRAELPDDLYEIDVELAPAEPSLSRGDGAHDVFYMSLSELVEFIQESGVRDDDVVYELDLSFPALSTCPPIVTLSHENAHMGIVVSNSYAAA